MAWLLTGGLWLGLLALAVASLAARFADRLWIGDVAAMFVPHLFGAALLLTGVAVLARRRAALVLGLGLAGLHGWTLLAPLQAPPPAAAAGGTPLRVMTFNVEFDSWATGRLHDFLVRERPDILVLEEAVSHWRRALVGWGDLYPYTTMTDQGRNIALIVASRYPMLEVRRFLGNTRLPGDFERTYIVRVVLAVEGRRVVLYAVHPSSPREPHRWTQRNLYLETLAQQIRRLDGPGPVIVAGDFNTAPWSPFFGRLLDQTGLVPAARSRWPAPTRVFKDLHLPAWLGVPVDHVLVSPGIGVRSYGPGPDLGSDHLPVLADLVLLPG